MFVENTQIYGMKEDHELYGWITLKWILERSDGWSWSELVWLKTGASGELL
jgi:hypothetical protein